MSGHVLCSVYCRCKPYQTKDYNIDNKKKTLPDEKFGDVVSTINIKTLRELGGLKFKVPTYQRGYRWGTKQVNDLLKDLSDFHDNTKRGNPDAKYCLQPLVVQKADGSQNQYLLVDGQQRLTTILILLLMADSIEGFDKYQIEYDNRPDAFQSSTGNQGVDAWFVAKSRAVIKGYIDAWNERELSSAPAKKFILDYVLDSICFIWYELGPNEDPIKKFKQINTGKTPLVSSELIKALLLNDKNYDDPADKDESREVQRAHNKIIKEGITREWQEIEMQLLNPEFWGFLCTNQVNSIPAIELVFNTYIAHSPRAKETFEKISVELNNQWSHSKTRIEVVRSFWDDAKTMFSLQKECYRNPFLYHEIGYLLQVGENGYWSISKNENPWQTLLNKNRDERKALIRETIRKSFSDNGEYSLSKDINEYLESLDYEDSHKDRIQAVLLLHNILTILYVDKDNSRKTKTKIKKQPEIRFPFDIYSQQNQSLEHIQAQADTQTETDNSLANLCLLDQPINSSNDDADFNSKRSNILYWQQQGAFIPICSLNCFLKVYSDQTSSPVNEWTEEDKKSYLCNIEKLFNDYFVEKEQQ